MHVCAGRGHKYNCTHTIHQSTLRQTSGTFTRTRRSFFFSRKRSVVGCSFSLPTVSGTDNLLDLTFFKDAKCQVCVNCFFSMNPRINSVLTKIKVNKILRKTFKNSILLTFFTVTHS